MIQMTRSSSSRCLRAPPPREHLHEAKHPVTPGHALQNAPQRVAERLGRPDMVQFLFGFLALLLFTVAVTWPSGEVPNDSWYTLVQVKAAALLLLSVGYGAAVTSASPGTQLVTLAALLSLGVLALPLELVTYAASFPETPLWWPLVSQPLAVVAYFGVGLALSRLFGRAPSLLPLFPPLVLIGAISFDVWLERALLSPVTVAASVSPPHLVAMGIPALLVFVLLMRASVRPTGHNGGYEASTEPAADETHRGR